MGGLSSKKKARSVADAKDKDDDREASPPSEDSEMAQDKHSIFSSVLNTFIDPNKGKTKEENRIIFGPHKEKHLDYVLSNIFRDLKFTSNAMHKILPKDIICEIIRFYPVTQAWRTKPQDSSDLITVEPSPAGLAQIISNKRCRDSLPNHLLVAEHGYVISESIGKKMRWLFEMKHFNNSGGTQYIGVVDLRIAEACAKGVWIRPQIGFIGFYGDFSNSSQPGYLATRVARMKKMDTIHNGALNSDGKKVELELDFTETKNIKLCAYINGTLTHQITEITLDQTLKEEPILYPALYMGACEPNTWVSVFEE